MQDERDRERAKIDGEAAFAGAAFLIGVGSIYLLARVGAPDGLVHALGPLFVLAGVGLLGALTRSTRVPAFLTADRAVPAPYAGLAFAAISAGFVLCLAGARGSPLPLAGVAVGLCVNALAVAPLLRASKASGLADLLATNFPALPLRIFLTALQLAIGGLVAAAGFEAATDGILALFELSRGGAAAIVAVTLILMLVPGGLAGLLWGAAASAGMMLIILALPIAAHVLTGEPAIASPTNFGDLGIRALAPLWGDGEANAPGMRGLVAVASGLAIATLAPFMTPAIASSGEGPALRAGGYGLIFAALIALSAGFGLALPAARTGAMSSGLTASAAVLAALVLAAAGAHMASRAWGINMAGRRVPLRPAREPEARAFTRRDHRDRRALRDPLVARLVCTPNGSGRRGRIVARFRNSARRPGAVFTRREHPGHRWRALQSGDGPDSLPCRAARSRYGKIAHRRPGKRRRRICRRLGGEYFFPRCERAAAHAPRPLRRCAVGSRRVTDLSCGTRFDAAGPLGLSRPLGAVARRSFLLGRSDVVARRPTRINAIARRGGRLGSGDLVARAPPMVEMPALRPALVLPNRIGARPNHFLRVRG